MTYSKRCPPTLCTTLHHLSNVDVASNRLQIQFNATFVPHFCFKMMQFDNAVMHIQTSFKLFSRCKFWGKTAFAAANCDANFTPLFFLHMLEKKKRKKKENFNGNLHAGQPAGRYGYCLLPRVFFC